METLATLRALIAQHCREPRTVTAIPGLVLGRADSVSTIPVQGVYKPMVCLIAQGTERVIVGNRTLDYDADKHLITSVDLPIAGRVTAASPELPYLMVGLALDAKILADILIDLPAVANSTHTSLGIAVSQRSPELLDAFVRLLRLLEQPADMHHLAKHVIHEIHYRLLMGEQSIMLQRIAFQASRTAQINLVINWIRENFAKPLHIGTLADIAAMSPPSLHRHFRATTGMSPLQYQKNIRLQEARRVMVAEKEHAAAAGFLVGYDSPSQFNREYRRLFGISPKLDADRLRSGNHDMLAAL